MTYTALLFSLLVVSWFSLILQAFTTVKMLRQRKEDYQGRLIDAHTQIAELRIEVEAFRKVQAIPDRGDTDEK